jgi:hypothetical protein
MADRWPPGTGRAGQGGRADQPDKVPADLAAWAGQEGLAAR